MSHSIRPLQRATTSSIELIREFTSSTTDSRVAIAAKREFPSSSIRRVEKMPTTTTFSAPSASAEYNDTELSVGGIAQREIETSVPTLETRHSPNFLSALENADLDSYQPLDSPPHDHPDIVKGLESFLKQNPELTPYLLHPPSQSPPDSTFPALSITTPTSSSDHVVIDTAATTPPIPNSQAARSPNAFTSTAEATAIKQRIKRGALLVGATATPSTLPAYIAYKNLDLVPFILLMAGFCYLLGACFMLGYGCKNAHAERRVRPK